MHLDMLTMSAVSFTVTSILGIVLIFACARAGATSFVGWWGLALILQSAGIAIAATSSFHSGDILTLGQATMVLADAVKWHASRQFAHRKADVFWTFAGPLGFLLAAHSGLVSGFDDRLILLCTLMALYNFAAAVEMSYANGERLVSRWPAVALLAFTGAGYLSWLPLIIVRPIESASAVFSSSWFPVVILVTLLLRIALAFIVLSMAKERQELERRADALTDALTGLPNRRALFEAADSLTQSRNGSAGPVSVLLFDLDHFKETNDTFGHEVGDRVLKLFASTLLEHLNGSTIVARLGGEEFAAIMLKTDLAAAALAAEVVRRAFAESAAVVDGLAIDGTVSVGAASDMHVGGDLSALFRRADAALYAAKRAGRNRVELLETDDGRMFSDLAAKVRSARHNTPHVGEHRSVKIGT